MQNFNLRHRSYDDSIMQAADDFQEACKLSDHRSVSFWTKSKAFGTSRHGAYHEANCYKLYANAGKIDLPEAIEPAEPRTLEDVMSSRQSHQMNGDCPSISGAELAYVIKHGISATRSITMEDGQARLRKPYPAAGAIYSVEFYFLLFNVLGFEPAILHFCHKDEELRAIAGLDVRRALPKAIGIPEWLQLNPDLAIVQTVAPQRAVTKYGTRGLRFAYLEAGLSSQCILLAAEAIKLRSLVWGAFYDNSLDKLIGLNGVDETSVNVTLLKSAAESE